MQTSPLTSSKAAARLVDMRQANPNIVLDIVYATANNFLGFPVYTHAVCYVVKDVSTALKGVQKDLAALGLGLKCYDGFRPVTVQQLMWDTIQDERYVGNPSKIRGPHTRGAAVDVTLIDREGRELEMPSGFDEFTTRAHLDYMGGSKASLENRRILQTAMNNNGFESIDTEWWHFHLPNWRDDTRYPPLDITFEELEA